MLRSRLYIGMLPVLGLLIAVSLYSVYNYRSLDVQLSELQNNHYAAVSTIEQLLVTTSQLDRAMRIENGDPEAAYAIFLRSRNQLNTLIHEGFGSTASLVPEVERELKALAQALLNIATGHFTSDGPRRDMDEMYELAFIVENIEETAVAAIADRNQAIRAINLDFQNQSKNHYNIVLAGIVSSIVLMGIVSYVLSQRILKPIDALTQAAAKLEGDDWETDYTPTSKDEIKQLEIAFLEMGKSIAEFKRVTNMELLRTRRRMEECFANFPHPVFFISADRSIVYHNQSAAELLGELGWDSSFPPAIEGRIETVFGTGEEMLPTDFDETISFKLQNQEQHFLPIVVRIDNEEADEIECALILQNITNLRLSDELKSDLVATLSHEIKTPVTSANMALHLLAEKELGDLNEEQDDLLKTAIGDLHRLQRLLDHMLQIAQLERKQPKLKTRPCSVSSIVQSVLEANSQIAEGLGATLRAQVDANLLQVEADRHMIEVALTNFVSNAMKYGRAQGSVTLYAKAAGENSIRIGVLDDGPGIPQEDTERIFDKFYRSKQSTTPNGVGLGLSICKDIVNAHGGNVGCENRPQGGTDMHLVLPGLA